jgi:hypothetical protein
MSNFNSTVLISILQKACTFEGDGHLSAGEYLKKYRRLIEETCRLLEGLGLAELDDQSELGWKPTARLVSIIAKQATRPLRNSKTRETQRDNLLLDAVIDLAHLNLDDVPGAVHYGFEVLGVLGLLRSSVDDIAWKPTRLLRQLVLERDQHAIASQGK